MTPHENEQPGASEAGTPTAGDEPSEARLERERDEFKGMAQRAQADLINYKRRVDEERRALEQNAANGIIVRLLPIADDLERAVGALPEETGVWADGVRMVLQSLRSTIEAVGVKAYAPEPGATFDPADHEAVYYEPTGDQPPGAVVTCVRPGYRSQERVLRVAQVVVAKAPEQADEGTTTPAQ